MYRVGIDLGGTNIAVGVVNDKYEIIGEGKRKPEEIIDIFKHEDRRVAGKTAPPCGLYLRNVFY